MTHENTDSFKSRSGLHLFLGFLLLSGINTYMTAPFWNFGYFSVDIGEVIYHARSILAGRVPYVDTYTHHFLGYTLPFIFVGQFFPLTPAAVWGMCIVSQTLVALLSYKTAETLSGKKAGLFAAALACSAGWLWGWEGMIYNLQSYIAPLLALYVLLLVLAVRKNSVQYLNAAALCYGLTVLFDQRLALHATLLLVVIVSLRRRIGFSCCLRAIILSAIPLSCVLLTFLFLGNFESFIDQTILFPLFHRNAGASLSISSLAGVFLKSTFAGEPLVFLLTITGFLLYVLREPNNTVRSLFLLYALVNVLYVLSGGRPFLHYVLIFGPFVILFSALCFVYTEAYLRTFPWLPTLACCLLCVESLSRPLILKQTTGSWQFEGHQEAFVEAGHYIEQHTHFEDNILVWNYAPRIYNLANRFSLFRDIGLITVAGSSFYSSKKEDQSILPEMEAEFKQYLEQTPPVLIAIYRRKESACSVFPKGCPTKSFNFDTVPHLQYFKDFLAAHYTLVHTADAEHDSVAIYKKVS